MALKSLMSSEPRDGRCKGGKVERWKGGKADSARTQKREQIPVGDQLPENLDVLKCFWGVL